MDLFDLAFMDCETSGLDPERDEIIEVCVVRLDPVTLAIRDQAHDYVMPIDPVAPEAAAVNGYSETLWRELGAASIETVLGSGRYDALLEGAMPTGQNPDFDRRFLRRAYERIGRPFPKMDHHALDMASLAWPVFVQGHIPGVSLRHTRALFRCPGEQKHRAKADVADSILTYRGFMRLYENAAMMAPSRIEDWFR